MLTDNGSFYRSKLFAAALGEQIKHKRTRPYPRQRKSKEIQPHPAAEMGYAQPNSSEAERAACFTDWLHTYNHHRGHTALDGKSPADLVPNLCGQNN